MTEIEMKKAYREAKTVGEKWNALRKFYQYVIKKLDEKTKGPQPKP